jgi:phospholipid transport system substrate-binding protein
MSQRWKTFERRHPLWTFILAMLIALSCSRPALAADPQARVREILEAVSAVMHDPQLQGVAHEGERKQRVRQIIFDTFAFDEMARIALGSHWSGLTSPQRTEFVGLFGNVFERAYTRLVLRFLPERETTYGAATSTHPRAVVQTTLIVRKTNEQLPVDYRLIEKEQRWRVYDVVVDGISLASNYRAQFDRIIRSSSYDTLVQKIKAQLAQASS